MPTNAYHFVMFFDKQLTIVNLEAGVTCSITDSERSTKTSIEPERTLSAPLVKEFHAQASTFFLSL